MKWKQLLALVLACTLLCSCSPKAGEQPGTAATLPTTASGESCGDPVPYQETGTGSGSTAVHGVYCKNVSGGVQFTVDYTAPADTRLHLRGDRLYWDGDFTATGQRDTFVFQLSQKDARDLGTFSLVFIREDKAIAIFEVAFGEGTVSELFKERNGSVPAFRNVTVIYPEPTVTATPLNVTWSWVDRDDDSQNAGVYGFSATELSSGTVRCVLDFLAPRGTVLTVYGNNLLYRSSFLATGERDRFVFDLTAEDARKVRTINVEFGDYPEGMFLISFLLNWPDQGLLNDELPLHSGGTPQGEPVDVCYKAPEGITVHRFTRQWLDNQCFRYQLEVTAPEGLTMQITGPEGQNYHEDIPTTGEAVSATFDLPWAIASLHPQIQVAFCNGSEEALYTLEALNGLLLTGAEETGEIHDLDWRVDYNWFYYDISDEKTVEVHSCTRQQLDLGFSRYSVEFTAPEGHTLQAHIGYNPDEHIENNKFMMESDIPTTGQRQTVTFDLKDDTLEDVYPVLSFHHPDQNPQYVSLFTSDKLQLSSGKPIGQVTKLSYIGNNFRTRNDLQLFNLTVQTLDNEMLRFQLGYKGAPGIIIHWKLDSAAGDDDYYTLITEEGEQALTFDLRFEQLRQFYRFEIAFWDEYRTRFVVPSVISFADLGVPTAEETAIPLAETEFNGVYTNLGEVEDSSDFYRQTVALIERIVQDIENRVRDLFTPQPPENTSVDTSCVQPLIISRKLNPVKSQDGVDAYGEYRLGSVLENRDISDNPALAYSLTYLDTTRFPDTMPAAYDPEALLEWGKNPGLNVDVLHALGYTGKGAVIAYVDQPAGEHPEYTGENLHYTNNTDTEYSMHGPGVLSLLMGDTIGTAPEAEVYYYAHAAWEMDQATNAECLYQLIEQNKSLPEGKKITMVGFSDNITTDKTNIQEIRDAVKACEEAGIMVWFCGEYGAASFLPLTDKDNFSNVIRDYWYTGTPELVFVPTAGRTFASLDETARYSYTYNGGLSWAMPYVLGIYAIVHEIDPSLTQADLKKMVVDTAYEQNGMPILDPVAFVSAALEGVGREEDAAQLRAAAEANTKYTYAVMNRSAMTASDITAVENYLKEIADSTVLIVDSSSLTTAQQLYTVLQADHARRGGSVVGVQIFGDASLVPAFRVGYQVQMEKSVDNAGTLVTDLFYGNFSNDPKDLSAAYNVKDHFKNQWNIRLTPQWKVLRLPLSRDQFAPFFDRYWRFAEAGGLTGVPIVNFSNPIFADRNHPDDMGTFLDRMHKELFLLDIPYTLYGNQLGQYPVTTQVKGGFTAENLTLENNAAIQEFIINGHGQKNNLDKCWYEADQEKRESLVNMQTINTVLSENPYYLDLWTCNGGEEMTDNITTTALSGSCVGMFSTTHLIANNGVDCFAGLETMPQSNFYYFYLHYLMQLSEGETRSDAFFTAQKHYANALLSDSLDGIEYNSNYQFNLCNLLGYHNFGIIEPNRAWQCVNSSIS